jgi:cytochrome c-type biogenesis protein CcmH/NrfF
MKMAKKKKARRQVKEQPIQKKESNFWMITAIVAIVLLVGVTAKTFFSSSQNTSSVTTSQPATTQPTAIQPKTMLPTTTLATNSLEEQVRQEQVRQVAVNFKCACGGCGELPLAECQCDMPKGAVEEKNFIRTKLNEGNSVPEVIELVDKKYGHRST